ncbi:hypothetical protein F511_25573 [Dorcoceras hygrometricum]|uniref:Dystroglycan-like n=1 Tax=Dorcoceras hygrometricum TaxID=472368 RepID=A0A2Z7C429_9LAMI|nr:hypothetical protein F511_25573 [Dorcoceras hygrometricum]
MASSLISNAIQINFDSVLGISDNDGMVNMFKALEASGLRGFLGCPYTLYERELEQFFDTAIVQEGDITCAVSGKYVVISESRFAGVFGLPTEGLTDISAVPKDLVYDARSIFSQSGDPAVTLGDATIFPQLKILSAKTVSTYVSTNKTIDSRGETVEPGVAKVAIVRKKSISKKKFAPTDADDEPVEVVAEKAVSKKRPAAVSEAPVVKKKRTSSGKASAVETVVVEQKAMTSVDDVDTIIGDVIAVTEQLEIDVVESDSTEDFVIRTDLTDIVEPLSKVLETTVSPMSDDESLTIEEHLAQIPEGQYRVWTHNGLLLRLGVGLRPVQGMDSQRPFVKTWGWFKVCTDIIRYSMFGCLRPVGSFNFCTDLVPVGSVFGDSSIPRRIVDYVSYRIQILESVLPDFSVQISPVVDITSAPTDSVLPSPHQSSTSASSMHFTDDIYEDFEEDNLITP